MFSCLFFFFYYYCYLIIISFLFFPFSILSSIQVQEKFFEIKWQQKKLKIIGEYYHCYLRHYDRIFWITVWQSCHCGWYGKRWLRFYHCRFFNFWQDLEAIKIISHQFENSYHQATLAIMGVWVCYLLLILSSLTLTSSPFVFLPFLLFLLLLLPHHYFIFISSFFPFFNSFFNYGVIETIQKWQRKRS